MACLDFMKTYYKTVIITSSLLFIINLFLRIWRISEAPDIFVDEPIYNLISNNLLTKGQLVYGDRTWFTHPPLYYVFLAGYLFINSQNSVTLNSIYIARTLSGILFSIMIVVTYLLITKIYDSKSAIIASVLLTIDPYLANWSRIGMLESTALMFIALTIYLFYKAEMSIALKRYIFAGIFLGLALLTKEIAGYIILVIIIYVIFVHYFKIKANYRGILVLLGVAAIIYLIYVAWSIYINANYFFDAKIISIKRITGQIITTGFLHERYYSLYKEIFETFWHYGTTHILVLLSIPSSIYIFLKERRKETVFLILWLYISFMFFVAIRMWNSQFYVYIIQPALIFNGLMLSSIIQKKFLTNSKIRFNKKAIIGSIFVILLVGYNGYIWIYMYGTGTDTSFRQSIDYIKLNIPEGTKLFMNPAYKIFLPNYELYFGYYSIDGLRSRGINYIVISPREHYMVSENTLDYILKNGRLIVSFEGYASRGVDIYIVY